MKTKRMFLNFVSAAAVSLGTCAFAQTDEASDPNLDVAGLATEGVQSLGTLQNQMESRVSQISLLKEQGLVGITNTGQLEVRGSISPMQSKMIQQENKDRKVYCQLLSEKYGSALTKIQEEYAAKQIKIAAPGTWVQDAEGDWFQK